MVDLAHIDLTQRELWTGLVLTPSEAAALQQRLHFDEAAARTVGGLCALDAKAKRE